MLQPLLKQPQHRRLLRLPTLEPAFQLSFRQALQRFQHGAVEIRIDDGRVDMALATDVGGCCPRRSATGSIVGTTFFITCASEYLDPLIAVGT
ncbi:MAG: hypothetical protein JF888_12425 [Candidatus Dormibacteraeota bacterium]|uniref:Uncharacterized protein n=1 Tax=Candidatus Dormiibacter inghamiae TaxID=3127013 RepID=A0A934NCY3_9BACT|nr:hypothetical protein [Candidatus Dormibacteraeota bacterium]MBJ7604760.1 hypothetical protein [Candidatus Dormibacteraeota bacterium]